MSAKWFDYFKQALIGLIVGAMVSVVPFYFHTNAMTDQNTQTGKVHTEQLNEVENRLKQLEVKGAVDDTEIRQIKSSLQRIETKIDQLIEKQSR